jgi:hypothetical protein
LVHSSLPGSALENSGRNGNIFGSDQRGEA